MKRAAIALALLATACSGSHPYPVHAVPSAVGTDYRSALDRFAGAGYCVGSVTGLRSDAAPFTILAQTPKAGVSLAVGTGVGVEVSKGRSSASFADRLTSSPGFCDRAFYIDGPCNTAGPSACHERRLPKP